MTLGRSKWFAPHLLAASLLALSLLAPNLYASGARGETLPLPGNLTDLNSDDGEKFFLESGAHAGYFAIADNFVTQKTLAYCGIAAIVMVLNAAGAPAPTTPEFRPYHIFTQDNLLDERSEAVLPQAVLDRQGMTLDQLGGLLALHPLTVEVHHAANGGLDAFRDAARDYLAAKDHFVIVNYLRKAIGQETGGHISPLAAYDAKVDRFLILDVARYKYPPVWVTASDLFDAMNTTDASNDNKTRGYVLIAKSGAAGAATPAPER
jgi:glutathione-S-conjugate glycine hydrolase